MYLSSSRADSISWKSRKTRASSYNRLIPRTILQNDGCGRMNGPSRNWTIENRRNETMEAYTPLSDVQCLIGTLTGGRKTHIRRLSRPSSRTSWVVATYANAPRARARAVSVKGLKKNLSGVLLSGARIVFQTTHGVLHACIHRFLEGFDLGVWLCSICLKATTSYGEPPVMRKELTSYPRQKPVNSCRSKSPKKRTADWGTTQTRKWLGFGLWR